MHRRKDTCWWCIGYIFPRSDLQDDNCPKFGSIAERGAVTAHSALEGAATPGSRNNRYTRDPRGFQLQSAYTGFVLYDDTNSNEALVGLAIRTTRYKDSGSEFKCSIRIPGLKEERIMAVRDQQFSLIRKAQHIPISSPFQVTDASLKSDALIVAPMAWSPEQCKAQSSFGDTSLAELIIRLFNSRRDLVRYVVDLGCWLNEPNNLWYDIAHGLMLEEGWSGLCVDSEEHMVSIVKEIQKRNRSDIAMLSEYVFPTNIADVLERNGVPKNLGVFKVDIDSIDCDLLTSVLKAGFRPDWIVVEHSPFYPASIQCTTQYPSTASTGCSCAAATDIGRRFGYRYNWIHITPFILSNIYPELSA